MRHRSIFSIIAIFTVFVSVLLAMNSYQYFRLKSNLVEKIVKRIGETEIAELHAYFASMETNLKLLRDLGRDVDLGKTPVSDLNRKYSPFLENQEGIEAVIVADSRGREYLITRRQQGFLTREASQDKENGPLRYKEWSATGELVRRWSENKKYSSIDRPWFSEGSAEAIYWTGIYSFFHSGKDGVTASISQSKTDKRQKTYNVFAIDISLHGIERILTKLNEKRTGLLFLVNRDGRLVSSSRAEEQNNLQGAVQLLNASLDSWMTQNRPSYKPIYFHYGGTRWISSFQWVGKGHSDFWIGLAMPEKDIEGPLEKAVLRIDGMEVLFASIGSLLTLFLMWKFGVLRVRSEAKKSHQERLSQYLAQGEGADIEFKSTVRTNLKSGKQGKEIEFSWLKSIAAFLNSKGGTLLLGVNDEGEVAGVEADGFDNNDKCLLHIKNLINHHIGPEYSKALSITSLSMEAKTVVMVECSSAGNPVFLKIGKNEEFYIRSGPSSVKLSPSQIVEYVQSR